MLHLIRLRKTLAELNRALENDESKYNELEAMIKMSRWANTAGSIATKMIPVNKRIIEMRATRNELVNEIHTTIDTYIDINPNAGISWEEKYDYMVQTELTKRDTQIATLEQDVLNRDMLIMSLHREDRTVSKKSKIEPCNLAVEIILILIVLIASVALSDRYKYSSV
jgi:oligoribonuclease NrnB/cAMP/cGMP phosphodiesterase (DHH superfamily)